MLRILRTLFESPDTLTWILVQIPTIITTVIIIRLGYFIWSKKVSFYANSIALGCVLVLLSYLVGIFINYLYIPGYSGGEYDQVLLAVKINAIIGNLGNLLLFWGLFRFFKREWKTHEHEDIMDNLIERK